MGEPPIATPNPDFAVNLNLPDVDVTPQATPIVPITPVSGGHLHITMPMAATLNPLLNSDPDVDAVLRLIFEPLVVLDDQKRPRPNPAITRSVVFSADGGSLAVSLHDDIFWEDGSPITAADIAFSIDVLRFSASEGAVHVHKVENIVSHAVLDTRTIQINLQEPSWSMKYMLNFPIIPVDYYSGTSMTNLRAARNMHPLGNGPFRFLSYDAAGSLELISNENATGGMPYITRITAKVLREMDGTRYAFEQGFSDILVSSPYDWGRYSAMGKTRAADVLTGQFDFIGFNANSRVFSDSQARAAAAFSFDLQTVLQRYYAQADATIVPINPESWLAAYDLPEHQFNPGRAAAYFGGLEGVAHITIIVNEDNPEGVGTATILADGLTQAHARVTLDVLPFSDFLARVESSDFDIVVGGALMSPAPDFGFLQTILGYTSEEMSQTLWMMHFALSESSLTQATVLAQHYVAENLPIIGIAFRREVLYTAGHVHGNIQIGAGDVFANIGNWFIYHP